MLLARLVLAAQARAPAGAEAWPPRPQPTRRRPTIMQTQTSKSDLLSFAGLMVTLVVTNVWFAIQVLTYAT
jgi:hypothetical protein